MDGDNDPQTRVPMYDLRAQFASIRDEVLPRVAEVLDRQELCQGPACVELENQIAAYCGIDHAVAVSSGTDALLVSLMGLDIGCGDEVITTPFTFFAVAGALWRLGIRPVFADIDPHTFNLAPRSVEAKLTERTKAIMPVHLFGQLADMRAFRDITERHNLLLIEDAAQAIGARRDGEGVGHHAHATALSFYPTKNLGGAGDAGMALTPDAELATRLRQLRNHGSDPDEKYLHHEVGGNFRMDSVNAAVLSAKLRHLDTWQSTRQQHAALYDELLGNLPGLQTPAIAPGCESIYNQYVIRTPRRDALKKHLDANGIGCAVYYPMCLHEQPCFASLDHQRGDLPESERAADEVLALPIYPELSEAQVRLVAETVRGFFVSLF